MLLFSELLMVTETNSSWLFQKTQVCMSLFLLQTLSQVLNNESIIAKGFKIKVLYII